MIDDNRIEDLMNVCHSDSYEQLEVAVKVSTHTCFVLHPPSPKEECGRMDYLPVTCTGVFPETRLAHSSNHASDTIYFVRFTTDSGHHSQNGVP